MLNIFQIYIQNFLSPFVFQANLRQARLEMPTLIDVSEFEEVSAPKLNLIQAMSVSWIFIIVDAIYSIYTIGAGTMFLTSFNKLGGLFFSDYSFQTERLFIYSKIFNVVIFPLAFYFFVKVWGAIIQFFANLYAVEGDVDRIKEEIVLSASVSHLFLIVPIIGSYLAYFTTFFYVYAGLRTNMQMSKLQSFTVIISPVLFIFLFIFLAMVYFALVLNIFR